MSKIGHWLGVIVGPSRGAVRVCVLTLASLFMTFTSARGDVCPMPGFVAPTRYDVGGIPVGLSTGDFNGDGIADLVVLADGYGESHVAVLLGNADGTFQAPIVAALSDYLYESQIVTGVFDKTGGHLDVLVGGYYLHGHGDGTFDPPVPTGVGSQSFAAADFDGDGNLDIAGTEGSLIEVALGDGHGNFGTPLLTPAWSPDVAFGDVDGDGLPDAIGTRSIGGPVYDSLVYYPGRGDGTFSPSVTMATLSTPDGLREVHVADLNEDGHPDVVALMGFSIVAQLGHGDGTFEPPVRSDAPPAPIHLALADFDGDGRLDLAVAVSDTLEGTTFGGNLEVLLGSGDGSFTPFLSYATGFGLYEITAGTLGSPSRAGVVLGGASIESGGPDTSVWVYFGNGNGTLVGEPQYEFATGVRALAVGDFNEDGRPDIADVWDFQFLSRIDYLFGGPAGRFTPGGNLFSGVAFSSLQTADLNGDGHLDLVTLDATNSALVVFLGDGHGDFTTGSRTPVPSVTYGSRLLFADLTGDGVIDAISVDPDTSLTTNQLGVLLGNGDGTFTPAAPLSFPVPVADAVLADFDGDGHADLAVVGSLPFQTGQLFVLHGNGNGTFGSPIVYETQAQPSAIVAGVFANGAPFDLVVGTSVDSGTGVVGLRFPGNGDGTFGSSIPISLGFAINMAVADFRGSGINDLIVVGYDQVSLAYGNGDGTFNTPIDYPAGISMSSLALGDFDGNGTLDAAAGNSISGAGGIMLFLNAQRAVSVAASTAAPGEETRLYSEAAGLGPLMYQWRKGGVPLIGWREISGSTTGMLTINPVSFADAGSYDVVVTDSCGTTLQPATLSVEFADVPTSSPFHDDILAIAQPASPPAAAAATTAPPPPSAETRWPPSS